MTAPTYWHFVWAIGAERFDILTENDWQRVEDDLIQNPKAGVTIQGLNGARKLRVRVGRRGKSGGARTIYLFVSDDQTVYFLATYGKNEQSDLTSDDRRELNTLIAEIKEE